MATTWQDIIKGFKAKKKKGDGAAATLVLLYLSLGKDFPYNMAKSFNINLTRETGWDEGVLEYVKKLKDKNQLSVLMKEMEEKGLLISEKETKGRRKRFYRINPKIIYRAETTEAEWKFGFAGIETIVRYKEKEDPEEINKLLNALEKQDRCVYYYKWNYLHSYDFIGFLDFLMQEAKEFNLTKVESLIFYHRAEIIGKDFRVQEWPWT
jgi:hypothetical protein